MLQYLITGHSGFLGSILKNKIQKNGLTLGRDRTSDIICDLSRNIPVIPKVNIVIHNAGKAHFVPKTEAEKSAFFHVNLEGTRNLLRGLEDSNSNIRSFIFISTVAVYGLEEGQKVKESQTLDGKSPYAKSKILAEELLIKWAQRNGIILGILRLPLVAGPQPKGNLRTMINGIRSGYYVGIGKSDARKSMVWGEDVASIIPILAEMGGIYNLTDGYHPSFQELEDTIAASLGKKRPFHIPLHIAKRIASFGDYFGHRSPITTAKLLKMTSTLTFDDSKAQRQLGWLPTQVLEKIRSIV